MFENSQKQLMLIVESILKENTMRWFEESDFTPEILQIIRKNKYKRYIPKYNRKEKHDRMSPEEQTDQMDYFKTSWQYWLSPSGEIVDANKMFRDLNIK